MYTRRLLSMAFGTVVVSSAMMRGHPPAPTPVCGWLTPAMLLGLLGHHFDQPDTTGPMYGEFPGAPSEWKCIYQSANDSLYLVTVIGALDASPAAAKSMWQRIVGPLSQMAPQGYVQVPGVGEDAFLADDSGLHVLKGRARFDVIVSGFPDDRQRAKILAAKIVGEL